MKKCYPDIEQVGFDGTSRVYLKNPSVQAWPRVMRDAIKPDPGKKFVYFDWKGAELYIASYWAKQENLLNWFNTGVDVHTEIAKLLLGKTEVTKSDRSLSKVCTFATIYGSEGGAVARQLNCSFEEAKKVVDRYLALFPNIVALRDSLRQYAAQTYHTKTIFGRYRRLSNLNSNVPGLQAKGLRQVFNTAIQGSCADLAKLAILKTVDLPGVLFKIGVFDSFLLEVDADKSEQECRQIAELMSDFSSEGFSGLKFHFDFAVGQEGESWGSIQSRLD